MKLDRVIMTTAELQIALLEFCAANGGVPETVIIRSFNSEIVVCLEPGGMITAEEFRHHIE